MKKALITGITGQDGSYLAELLLEKGYEVYGMARRSSTEAFERIEHIRKQIHLHEGDLLDQLSLIDIMQEVRPDEVYNLAAQSFVPTSWKEPVLTGEFTALGVTRMLEAIRLVDKGIKFYQASSSEMFGQASQACQSERTPFHPRSPYACAKVYAYWQTLNYREAYGLFACNGILFNHESPRRGETFVSRKITRAAARIKLGLQQKLYLGNLSARRDWGFAGDYVEAMWLMLQQDHPDDYVIATGQSHSVQEFLEQAFGLLELDWRQHLEVDPRYFRPSEVPALLGDASKAQEILGWKPRVGFPQLVKMMVEADLELARREALLNQHASAPAPAAPSREGKAFRLRTPLW